MRSLVNQNSIEYLSPDFCIMKFQWIDYRYGKIWFYNLFSLLHYVNSQLNQHTLSGGGDFEASINSNFQQSMNNAPVNNRNNINLALSPIENDLLSMNIKYGGEGNYNIHELPNNDGELKINKSIFKVMSTCTVHLVFYLGLHLNQYV